VGMLKRLHCISPLLCSKYLSTTTTTTLSDIPQSGGFLTYKKKSIVFLTLCISQKTRKQELRLLVVAGVSDESEHLHTRCAIVIHCGGGSTNHYKLCVKFALILMFAPLTQQTHHPI